MENRVVLVNEALCFLSNKYDNIQHNDLKTVLASFYRDEELVAAKEVLVKAVQQCFRDINAEADMPRLPRRQGDNKIKQTVDDILKLFTLTDERKLRDALPTFVAGDLTRIPFVSNDGFLMVTMARRLEAMEQRLVLMEERSAVSPTQGKRDVAAAEAVDQLEQPRRQAAKLSTGRPSSTADSDVHDLQCANADDNDAEWSTVVKKRGHRFSRPPAQVTRQQNNVMNVNSQLRQPREQVKTSKVFGTCKSKDILLKPGVDIIQKAVVHIDNLSPDCTEALLNDYLLCNDVQVLTCYKAKSWLREQEQDKVTAFRVCVPLSEREKIFDPQMWSEGVIIRKWRFKNVKQDQQIEASRTNNGAA